MGTKNLMSRIFLISIFSFLLLSSCGIGEDTPAVQEFADGEYVWAFIQFNVPEKGGKFEDYYYFGKINKELSKKISINGIHKGFILLKDVRFWDKDNNIQKYADGVFSGDLIFKIEDIRKISIVKKEPQIGKPYSPEEIKKDLTQEEKEGSDKEGSDKEGSDNDTPETIDEQKETTESNSSE